MIIVAIGVAAGWAIGFLLSDGRRHSALMMLAGVVGAVFGAMIRWAAGPEGPLVLFLTALVGAMAASFAVGAHQFSHRA
ncbi:MAG TPA: hypothetical protein VFT29_19130 [Gemmatimonadaceae bacterium]|nr:hypothetical protein [Gemmatimonadaceae bacterium]